MKRVHRRDLAAVSFVALIPRLIWLAMSDRPPVGLHDPAIYLSYGKTLAEQGEYLNLFKTAKTAYFPVGYPFFVSMVMRLGKITHTFTDGHLPQQAANVALSICACCLVYYIALRCLNRRIALISGLMLALLPSQILYSTSILSEPLYALVLLLAVALIVSSKWKMTSHPRPAAELVGFGIVLGAATMVRGTALILPFAFFVVMLKTRASWSAAWKSTLLVLVGLGGFVAPWLVRNVVVFESVAGLSTNVGDDFCIGNADGATGAFELPPACFKAENGTIDTPSKELGRSRELMRIGIDGVLSNPGKMPSLTVKKFQALMGSDFDGQWAAESYGEDRFLSDWLRDLIVKVTYVSWFGLCIVSAIGAVILWRSTEPRQALLVAFAVMLMLLPLAFFGEPRFHHSMVPFMVIAAATALDTLWQSVPSRR